MTYQDIIDRVIDNLGKPEQSSVFLSIIKKDIYDVLLKLYRKAEPIKAEQDATITDASQEVAVASDFFLPLEVLFYDSDGLRFPTKELQYEEYLRWDPDVEASTTSFSELVTGASPASMIYTKENFDLDGLVGYVFIDESAVKLKWKPAINGSLKIYYVTYPTSVISTLTSSPAFHKIFHELIVLEVTIKHIVRRLGKVSNEIELYGLQQQLSHYKRERDETLSNFAGFVNRNVSAPVVEMFDFLNDYGMTILS